jgi:hypothetical protein
MPGKKSTTLGPNQLKSTQSTTGPMGSKSGPAVKSPGLKKSASPKKPFKRSKF